MTMTPYAAPIDSRFITTALSGTSTLRKTISNSTKLSSSTPPMNHGSRLARTVEKSTPTAVCPPMCTLSGRSRRKSCTRCSVAADCGDVVGKAVNDRDPAVGALRCRLDERDARCVRDLLHDRRHCRSSGVGRGVDDDHERTVDARAEAVGEPVVGIAGRGADGVVAGVGHGEPHAESRAARGRRARRLRSPRSAQGDGSPQHSSARSRSACPSAGAGRRAACRCGCRRARAARGAT